MLREPAWLREFKAFLMRGSVVDLAVGLVIGAAFTTIVTSLVEDLINPLIGLAIGGVISPTSSSCSRGSGRPRWKPRGRVGRRCWRSGNPSTRSSSLVIVSFAIFWVVVKLLARLRLDKLGAAEKVTPPAEVLLAEIRDELRAQRPR